MTALPHDETARWVAEAREALRGYPTTIPGPPPARDPISVGHQGAYAQCNNPCWEDPRTRAYVPIELEIAPGATVPLAEVKLAYPSPGE